MRNAIATDLAAIPGIQVVLTHDSRFPPEPGPWRVVRMERGAEQDLVPALAADCDATLVIAPETDGILKQREAWVRASGGRSLGSTPQAIALATDKQKTGLWLADHGLPVVQSQSISAGSPWPLSRPRQAILKPVDGAGSLDTFYLGPDDPWPFGEPPETPMLLQPFLVGQPASASFLIKPNSGDTLLVGTTYQRMAIQGNRLNYLGGSVPAAIPQSIIERLITTLPLWEGLSGWVGIDLVIGPEPDQATILEVNPRLTTSYVGLRHWVEGGGPRLAPMLLGSADLDSAVQPWRAPFTNAEPGIERIDFLASGQVSISRSESP